MNLHTTLMASCALALIGTTAMADCAEDLARLHAADAGAGQTEGIAKDGSLAPLETPEAAAGDASVAPMDEASDDMAAADAGGTAPAGDMAASDDEDMAASDGMEAADSDDMAASDDGEIEGGIIQDGSLAPLQGTDAEPGTPVATSGQDVAAQQEGEPTAAEVADQVETTEMPHDTTTAGSDVAADGDMTSDDAATMESAGTSDAMPDRAALIAEAEAALAAGDEEACRAAVDQLETI
ncbi:hypothetical protein E4L95_06530 [Paracoccus liaowanqingii]|uniref:Uncharacterized protein n=1 Tax=Paracoccus liaowanqingii TaxID=2560053 RepID=A0A4Z1CIH0_9RHOB|nr:hypothetical protein [Paracoccus liaowanqingii]TGN62474.1 hypothetical protein E4L95_06530 [Paracoccus liaowanqingii]